MVPDAGVVGVGEGVPFADEGQRGVSVESVGSGGEGVAAGVERLGESTVTPPSASVMPLNPPKSISATWSTRTSSSCSTVCTVSGTPPQEYAALIFARPCPGTSTHESRMIDIRYTARRSAGTCASMRTSDRPPETPSPSGSSLARLSEPMSRMFSAPRVAAGRSPPGKASVMVSVWASKLRARPPTKMLATTAITVAMPTSEPIVAMSATRKGRRRFGWRAVRAAVSAA
ncbi:hypothetical protein JN350_04170 [Curtobacterium sp. 24E2]|nr:hypothetical protein JN350_04170 [Curtobacterium sp. 24E2]